MASLTFFCFATESTYWILISAFKLSSNIFVKYCWSSEPRKCLIMAYHSGGSAKLPRLGRMLLLKMRRAVDLPIPFVPTRPRTWPTRGVGSLCSLKLLAPYRWVTCRSRPLGRLMILMAEKGQRLMHIPQPWHRCSEMKQIVEVGFTSIQRWPVLLTGQVLAHSYLHFLGLHLSGLMIAILSFWSAMVICCSHQSRLSFSSKIIE